METLIKLVKIESPVKGYERHYRVEGTETIKIVFVPKPHNGGK